MTEYRNPQNEPGSDKRMLLALLLVFVVLGVMQYLHAQAQDPAPETVHSNNSSRNRQPQDKRHVPPASSTPAPPKTCCQPCKVPVKAAAAETESVLETEYYRITFTNRGASVKSWILKKYKDNAGKPFDMVNQTVAAQLGISAFVLYL